MTVETIDVRPLWRRAWWRAVLVPLIVLTPLVSLAPTADHRFNLYWHGGLFAADPGGIVTHTLGTLDTYLALGNFRPLGRMLEKALDLLAFGVSDVFGVPVNVSFRLVSFLGAVLLSVAAVWLAESVPARGRPLYSGPPSFLAAVVPFAVGGGFVAAGGSSPAVLFGGLYFTSAALVFAVAALVCRAGSPRRFVLAGLVVGGALLACVNEIVYLAVPVASVVARSRRVVGALWAGFLPVFVVVRVVIYRHCADGGCYRQSDITLGSSVVSTLPERAVAWLPPLMWDAAVVGSRGAWVGVLPLVASVLLGVLVRGAWRDLPLLSAVDFRALARLLLVGVVLVVLGAVPAALNAGMQGRSGPWGLGWRDTAVTAAAGGLVLAALGGLWVAWGSGRLAGWLTRARATARRGLWTTRRSCRTAGVHWPPTHEGGGGGGGRRVAVLILLVGFAVSATVGVAANQRFADRAAASPRALLANRVALEMASFDRSPAGDARRCALRAEFRAEHADAAFSLRRFDESLDVAARRLAGMPFCAAATAGVPSESGDARSAGAGR